MTVVFRNGSVFDGHDHVGRTDVAVEAGRIVAVGPDLDHAGEVVDLAGGMLAPGFVDAHVHAVQGGLERVRCNLSELGEDRAAYLTTIAAYASAHPRRPWILGGGWSMAAFPGGTPTAAELDKVVSDRPAFLPNRDHHGAWLNTAALRRAGIDRHTPDPPHGRIERDAAGEPTGTLHEGAMRLVTELLPRTHDGEYYAALLEGQRFLHSLGVTGWQDAIVGAYAGMDDPGPVYWRAARNGDLTAHVVGALWWERGRGVEQLPELRRRRDELTLGRFRATSVKVMQDGAAENGTAALLAPYLDTCGHVTENRGHSFVDALALRRAVAALDHDGFQIHVHAIGDRAVRETLDAFAGLDAQARRPDLRHHMAHLQLVHPDDVPRFAELGIAANVQTLWACREPDMVELTLPFLGEERGRQQYPFGDLHRSGARLVAGSDWPVSSPNPLLGMHTAVNRTAYAADGPAGSDPFIPEQSVDLRTAFAAYTSGSAWINHRDEAGVIRPGAVADLVVLDRDPFAGAADEIGATKVVSTWVDGVKVHG